MIRQRIEWVDYAKAAAIFMVLLVHVHCDESLTKLIKNFTMPIFFFISGFLFSYENNPRPDTFARKRFRQIIVPYLWINIIAWACWAVLLRHFGNDACSATPWHAPLINILTGYPTGYPHDTPLWSLLCFFVVEITYYNLGRIIRQPWLIAAIFFALAYGTTAIGVDLAGLPLTIGPAICGVAFYAVGNGCRRFDFKPTTATTTLIAIVSLVILVTSSSFNGLVNFYICQYGNFALFLCASMSGCALVIAVSALISRAIAQPRLIRFISDGTLIICGFHLLCFSAIKGVMWFCFDIYPEALTKGLWRGLLFALTAFAMTLPLVHVIRQHFRFLIGK